VGALVKKNPEPIRQSFIRISLYWAGCGKFRKDLYYRLNVVQIVPPPLRDRKDDVPILARHFLDRHAAELGKKVADFSPDAMQSLLLYDWPGNVRELEHVVERAVIFSEGQFVRKADIRLSSETETAAASQESIKEAKRRVVERFEQDYIRGLLSIHGGNIARAARAAQKDRRAFWELMRKYGILAEEEVCKAYKNCGHEVGLRRDSALDIIISICL
jgi:two-component system response regulator GlrR